MATWQDIPDIDDSFSEKRVPNLTVAVLLIELTTAIISFLICKPVGFRLGLLLDRALPVYAAFPCLELTTTPCNVCDLPASFLAVVARFISSVDHFRSHFL